MGEKDMIPRESSDLIIRMNDLVRRGLGLLENLEKTDLVAKKASMLTSDTAGQIVQSDESLWIVLTPGIKIEFVRVPAGEFLMGLREDDPDSHPVEKPQHRVYLDEYMIGMYPVTNRQYQAFVNAVGYKKPRHWGNGEIPQNKQDHPVIYVSWQDASAFCQWASKVSGLNVRLPTEAEWEKAARGTDGRTYPWGEDLDNSFVNYDRNVGNTTKVGSYESGKSPYGASDMAGNVWEWVADWSEKNYYQNSPMNNPPGPSSGQYRVARGGSWVSNVNLVRSAFRSWDVPSFTGDDIGFRCARGISP
jgi:serine/threonine-protein kinase